VLTRQCTRQPRAVQGFNFNAQPLAHGAGLRLKFLVEGKALGPLMAEFNASPTFPYLCNQACK
jgi:hypothetical protein